LVGSSKSKIDKGINAKDLLENIPLIFRERGSGTRQLMERFINKHKILVLKKMELTSNEAVKQALLAGLGYSIMPLIGIRNELLHHELQIIPIKGLPVKTTWSLVWLKSKKHSPVAAAFINHLKQHRISIVNEKFKWYEAYQ